MFYNETHRSFALLRMTTRRRVILSKAKDLYKTGPNNT